MDRNGIATRLRGLIGGQDKGDLGAIAARLGVNEVSLRTSVDLLAPHPTHDVIAAIVAWYGVDPSWLLTGEYNSDTHRRAARIPPDKMTEAMREMIRAHQSPDESGMDLPPLRLMNDG